MASNMDAKYPDENPHENPHENMASKYGSTPLNVKKTGVLSSFISAAMKYMNRIKYMPVSKRS